MSNNQKHKVIVKVQLRNKANLNVTIPGKIAKRQNIRQGDFLLVDEHVCGGLIYRKID